MKQITRITLGNCLVGSGGYIFSWGWMDKNILLCLLALIITFKGIWINIKLARENEK